MSHFLKLAHTNTINSLLSESHHHQQHLLVLYLFQNSHSKSLDQFLYLFFIFSKLIGTYLFCWRNGNGQGIHFLHRRSLDMFYLHWNHWCQLTKLVMVPCKLTGQNVGGKAACLHQATIIIEVVRRRDTAEGGVN